MVYSDKVMELFATMDNMGKTNNGNNGNMDRHDDRSSRNSNSSGGMSNYLFNPLPLYVSFIYFVQKCAQKQESAATP